MVALPTLIPLSEAARKYGLEEERLRELVEKGKIQAGRLPGSDEVLVSEDEVRKRAEKEQGFGLRKEDLPEYKKHADKRGRPIWISKAEEDYAIPQTTLRQWIKRGLIKVLGTEKNKILLDEADVAYCNEIHKKYGRKGRILFNRDGTPYQPKRLSLK